MKRFLTISIILQLCIVLYISRDMFLKPYDVPYWKDRFEHSQWVLPLSQRSIGDDGLYAYIGYEIAGGADPTFITAEVPPVGKYLLGWSIRLTGHYWPYTIFSGVVTLVLLFDSARRIAKSTSGALLVVLLTALDPLFFSQLTTSLLDLTQLMLLLLSVWCMLLAADLKNPRTHMLWSIFSGVSLGLAAQTKMPLIIPVVGALMAYYLYRRISIHAVTSFVVGGIVGYITPYAGYFMLGHSIADFIAIQKYMIGYYRISDVQTFFGGIFAIIVAGRFPDIASHHFTQVLEWWLLWPIAFFGSIMLLIRNSSIRRRYRGLFLYAGGVLLIYSLIPAFPRYLLVVLPVLYTIAAAGILLAKPTYQRVLIVVIVIYGVYNTAAYMYQVQDRRIDGFTTALSRQYFSDVYQEFIAPAAMPMDRAVFDNEITRDLHDAQIRYMTIEELRRTMPFFGSVGSLVFRTTYHTQHLGSFSEEHTIALTKQKGTWYVDGDWNMVLDGYDPSYSFVTEIVRGTRGALIDESGVILAHDTPGYMILVHPARIDPQREQAMLELIGNIITVKPVHIQNAYLEDPLDDTFIPIGSNTRPVTDQEISTLQSFPGVAVEPYGTRLYDGLSSETLVNALFPECCTRLYSPTSYRGAASWEKEFDHILAGQDGGRLIMIDSSRAIIRVLAEKDGINGTDVHL